MRLVLIKKSPLLLKSFRKCFCWIEQRPYKCPAYLLFYLTVILVQLSPQCKSTGAHDPQDDTWQRKSETAMKLEEGI